MPAADDLRRVLRRAGRRPGAVLRSFWVRLRDWSSGGVRLLIAAAAAVAQWFVAPAALGSGVCAPAQPRDVRRRRRRAGALTLAQERHDRC